MVGRPVLVTDQTSTGNAARELVSVNWLKLETVMASEQISLFEDSIGRMEAESQNLTLVSSHGRSLTKAQRAFNRLVGEVEALRSKIERETRRLDDALAYYAQHLHPRLRRRTELRKEYVRALAAFIDGKGLK
ncbi:MAG TPA: hypothetical protein VNT76_04850, partial [Candidatus Binatus sp.]|nr:hypothetical protein [Candidatus Binatus sp.]